MRDVLIPAIVDVLKVAPREIAKSCLGGGVVGGVLDAAQGVYDARESMQHGDVPVATAVKHVVNESACGAFSSAAGVAAGAAAGILFGMTSAPVLAGFGTTICVRYGWRKLVPPILPTREESDPDEEEEEGY